MSVLNILLLIIEGASGAIQAALPGIPAGTLKTILTDAAAALQVVIGILGTHTANAKKAHAEGLPEASVQDIAKAIDDAEAEKGAVS